MNWIELNDEGQVSLIKEKSKEAPQVIFKHSTRCAVSSVAKNRLERGEQPEGIDFYFLDLIRHRNISQKIAADFSVFHESPQILLIQNGECVYDESHSGISMSEIEEQAGLK
ncbi:MAG: bacillithiol system redox-active protein YtxJ [Chitinophagaceae bacterium]